MVDSQPLLVAIVGRIETEKMVEMIAAGLTAAGTILLAVVAVFQDAIRRWLTRPKLELQLSPCAPDFHRTTIRHFYTVWNPQTGMPGYQQSMEIPCYYFRLRIINKGNCEAREVEVLCEGFEATSRAKGRVRRCKSIHSDESIVVKCKAAVPSYSVAKDSQTLRCCPRRTRRKKKRGRSHPA